MENYKKGNKMKIKTGLVAFLVMVSCSFMTKKAMAEEPKYKLVNDSLDFSRIDHKAHFILSYAIDASINDYLQYKKVPKTQRLVAAATVTLLLGLAKELSDSQFSIGDLKADALGVATSTLFHWKFSF